MSDGRSALDEPGRPPHDEPSRPPDEPPTPPPNPSGMLCTFDCYGTLIDWETGILKALRTAFPRAHQVLDDALLDAFHSAQNDLKTSAYRPYRQLLTETAAHVARAHGWASSSDAAGTVPASIPSWRPFPDTNDALSRLDEAGVTLGILSNIDNDLLTGTLRHFEVRFALLGTAQNLESYKPAGRHFERGREWAAEYEHWIHVAQSLFHDIRPTTAMGIPSLWVNRKDEPLPDDARPEYVAPDLAHAVSWLLGDRPPT